ncbi:hypothetical protein ACER0C_002311 [Sarotherodon galilaeus]
MNTSIPAPASAPLLLRVLMSVAPVCVGVLLVLLVLLVRRCVHRKPEDQEETGEDNIISHVMYCVVKTTIHYMPKRSTETDSAVLLSSEELKTSVIDKQPSEQGGPDFKPEPDVIYSSLK